MTKIPNEHNGRYIFYLICFIIVSNSFKTFETRQQPVCIMSSYDKKNFLELSPESTLAPSNLVNKYQTILVRYTRSKEKIFPLKCETNAKRLWSVVGSVIQATGRSEFEDSVRAGIQVDT